MLIFDKEKFEIVDRAELTEHLSYYDEDGNEIVDPYYYPYALKTKEPLIIYNDDHLIKIKKGEDVLRGNRELFFGEKERHFKNSYIDKDIIVNLEEGADFNLNNSVVKAYSVFNQPIMIPVSEGFRLTDSNIGLSLIQRPQNDEREEFSSFLIKNITSTDSNVTLKQDVLLYKDINFANIKLERVKTLDVKPFNYKSMGFIEIGGNVDISIRDLTFYPKTSICIDYTSNRKKCVLDNVSIQSLGKNNQSSIELYGYKDISIKNINFKSNFDVVSLMVDEIGLSGNETNAPGTISFLGKKYKDANKDELKRMYFRFNKLLVNMEGNSELNFINPDFSVDNEICVANIYSKNNTKTDINLKILEDVDFVKITNNKLKDMVIDTDFLFRGYGRDTNLVITDSSIVGGSVIAKSHNNISIKDSNIKDSELIVVQEELEDHVQLNLKDVKVVVSDCKFEENGKVSIKDYKVGSICISDSTFLKDSITDIECKNENSEATRVECSTFNGKNTIKNIADIKYSKINECVLEDVKSILKSEIEGSFLKNIEKIENKQIKNETLSFNVSGFLPKNITDLKIANIAQDSIKKETPKIQNEQIDF